MGRRPTQPRDVLVRTLPAGSIEITDAGDRSFIALVTTKHALDAFVSMHRLRVVTRKPKQETA